MKLSQTEIQQFLEGEDPENYIVAVEYDYRTSSIYKIKETKLENLPLTLIRMKFKFT